jgi:hypothetical protein
MRSLARYLAVALACVSSTAWAQTAPAGGDEPTIEIGDDAAADKPAEKPAEKPAAPAPAMDKKEEKRREKERSKLVGEGDKLFKKGDLAGALAKYQQAYELLPTPLLYYPMAKAEEQLNRPLDAIDHYEKFLAEGAELIKNEDLKVDAQVSIQELEKKLAVVTFDVEPDGVTITIDDAEAGTSPLGKPVRLMPGTHKVVYAKDGYISQQASLDLVAGDRPNEKVVLEPVKQVKIEPVKPKAAPHVGPPAAHRGVGWLYTGLVLTGACGLGWAITGSIALDDHDTYTDTTKTAAERADARTSGRNMAHLSDALLGGAVLAGGFTIYWYYAVYSKPARVEKAHPPTRDDGAPPPPGGDDEDEPPGLEGAMLLPWVDGQGGGVAVMGSF